MKVDALANLAAALSRGQPSLTVEDGGKLASTLTLGQIIKARVLRSYEGQRYLADLDGHERVVDSTLALRPGETFHGRVVALGERIEIQRLPAASGDGAERAAPQASPEPRNGAAQSLRALFDRYRAVLDTPTLEALQQVVGRAADPQAAALAALVLAKQGLPPVADWVRALQERLSMPRSGAAVATSGALHFETAAAPTEPAATATPLLAAAVAQSLATTLAPGLAAALAPGLASVAAQALGDESAQAASPADAASLGEQTAAPGFAAPGSGSALTQRGGDRIAAVGGALARDRDGSRRSRELPADVADWILNGQAAGVVAHRYGRLPLVVDGRLAEFDVALFEEARPAGGDSSPADERQPPRYRQIALSLETATLGRVEVRARLAADHLQIEMSTPTSDGTAALAHHSRALSSELAEQGWQVDALAYATRNASQPPAARVVEHLIRPGSVSRVV
jgi:Flagellar hook-length control protein FliK